VRTAESSTARVEAIGTFQGTNQFVERHFACDDVSQEDGLRLRANILNESPYLRSLYPSPSLLAKVSHMSFYTKLITEQQVTTGKLEYTRRLQTEKPHGGEHLDQPKQEKDGRHSELT
jgi:hypothetical protein